MNPNDRQFYVAAKALVYNSKGELLLLLAVPNKPYHKWEPYWDVPGGKISTEGVTETLRREISEEIGIDDPVIKGLHGVAISNIQIDVDDKKFGLFYAVYDCGLPEGAEIRISDEHSRYEWVGKAEAKQRLRSIFPDEFLKGI